MIKFNDGASMGDVRTGTIHAIVDEVNSANTRIGTLNTEVNALETSMTSVEGRLTAIENGGGESGDFVLTAAAMDGLIDDAAGNVSATVANNKLVLNATVEGGNVNLENYYTKTEADAAFARVATLIQPSGNTVSAQQVIDSSHCLILRDMTITMPLVTEVVNGSIYTVMNMAPSCVINSTDKLVKDGAQLSSITLAAGETVQLIAVDGSQANVYIVI